MDFMDNLNTLDKRIGISMLSNPRALRMCFPARHVRFFTSARLVVVSGWQDAIANNYSESDKSEF